MKRIFHFRATAQLGPLERRLLEALWERRSATVRELLEVCCRDLAYTTVMTTMDRLFKKDLLTREAEGRAYRYRPIFTKEQLHRDAAGEALRQLREASPASGLPLSYLVEIVTAGDDQSLNDRLLDDLGRLVAAKRRELRERKKGQNREEKP